MFQNEKKGKNKVIHWSISHQFSNHLHREGHLLLSCMLFQCYAYVCKHKQIYSCLLLSNIRGSTLPTDLHVVCLFVCFVDNMSWRSFHISKKDNFLITALYSLVCILSNLSNHFPIDEHFGYFQYSQLLRCFCNALLMT